MPQMPCIVLLCLLGSSFEDESVFGLRLWQVQKVVCSSLCLHIRKPKNLSRTESGKIFWLMDVQIQAWTNSLLHLPKPQSKHTRSFKPATHQTKTQQICFFRLWMCKRTLEQIPFCTCQNPNSNTLSSSELLPTNKEATLQHLLRTWAKIGDQSCVPCMVH